MPDAWTGVLVGKMHNKGVTYEALAAQLGVTNAVTPGQTDFAEKL